MAPASTAMAPASTAMSATRLARQQSLKFIQEETQTVEEILEKQKISRQSSRKVRTEEQSAREARMTTFNKSVKDLAALQWNFSSRGLSTLDLLPNDVMVDGRSVTEREPHLLSDLAELLSANFTSLFDAYLYYAKVDSDVDLATELYYMTESSWKALLRDAQIIGAEKYQLQCLNTMDAALIFKQVNARRENLEKGIGKGGGGGLFGEQPTNPAALSAVVQSAVASGSAEQPTHTSDLSSTVLKSHYGAGGKFSFTFSEYLEGLVICAMQLFPPSAPGDGGPRPPLSAKHVLASVKTIIEQRVLKAAKQSGSLQFRKLFLESTRLTAAMEAIGGKLDALHAKYAKKPKVITQGVMKGSPIKSGQMKDLLDAKRFTEMCQEAELVGPSLSLYAVKNAFVYSLEINAEETGHRVPLLRRGPEFAEAVLRLTAAYDPKLADRGPLVAPKHKKPLPSGCRLSSANAAAEAGESAGESIAIAFAATEFEEEATEEEQELLDKLPLVCGKLLALNSINIPDSVNA
uniref:Uncharacterized protein n=1 Tax=Haptolina brevifila TaxID=156173 RepID=A0A7S2H1K7_9EUKA